MADSNGDLHGSAPDRAGVALLIIDTINDLEWDGGDRILAAATRAADRIAALKARARSAGIPVIYANDNFGRWRSDFREVVNHCLGDDVRGRPLAERLRPDDHDYFVLKPKHSAFFATTLETLLGCFGCRRLILTGITGDICVLFTANEAHMREFTLHVPEDCLASVEKAHNDGALRYMERVLGADTAASDELDLHRLAALTDPQATPDLARSPAVPQAAHAPPRS